MSGAHTETTLADLWEDRKAISVIKKWPYGLDALEKVDGLRIVLDLGAEPHGCYQR
jgi:hypothetical protein